LTSVISQFTLPIVTLHSEADQARENHDHDVTNGDRRLSTSFKGKIAGEKVTSNPSTMFDNPVYALTASHPEADVEKEGSK
jgi:hypothetical protein